MKAKKRIFIVSAIEEEWGGSESLWFAAVPHWLEQGVQLFVLKRKINRAHPTFAWLAENGVLLTELINTSSTHTHLKEQGFTPRFENEVASFCIQLEVYKPDLVIINQGVNFDGLYYGWYAHQQHIPYCILAHKAVDFFWPPANERSFMKTVWQHSLRNYFVSAHNLQMTQRQFGMDIPRTERVYYPIRTYAEPLPFPAIEPLIKLACIGRLFLLDKGQDILLQLLAEPQWRNRNIQVDIIGRGGDEDGLREMAGYLGLDNIQFIGFSTSEQIWKDYHALVLPSRSEGLPLVVQEAMAAGRIAIAGNAGGTNELVQDGINGFLGEANLTHFRSTLERAWERRSEWQAMGAKAFSDFTVFYPKDTVYHFAQSVKSLA